MKKIAVLKNDLCPICYHERGPFAYKEVEGICEACLLRMMYAFDHTIRGGSIIRQDGACFCCHRRVDPDALYGGACCFCRQAGLVYFSACRKNEKINKRHVPTYPPALFFRKDTEKYLSDPLKYFDMNWDVPEGTEWEEEGAEAK